MLALMTLMNPLGTMVGFVIPYLFVNTDDTPANMKTQFFWFFVFEGGVAIFFTMLTLIFLKSQPTITNTNASTSAAGASVQQQQNYASLANQQQQTEGVANTEENGAAYVDGNNQVAQEEDVDDLTASQKIPVTVQYKILFRDKGYFLMLLGGSNIFGIMGAVGGSIVQEATIWGQSEVEVRLLRILDLTWQL